MPAAPPVPRTVIVKWARTHRLRAHTEPAALRSLSDDLGLALAPRVIAADLSAGLVVMKDLAPRTALDHLLRRDGPAAHADRLAAFARARGELSAATVGHAHPSLDQPMDAVCLYVTGPAWISVGDPTVTGLADHYRSALADGVPEVVADQRYGFGLAAACLCWAIVRLQQFAVLDTRPPGDGSRPQLVATLNDDGCAPVMRRSGS